jgi:hypothetical protein
MKLRKDKTNTAVYEAMRQTLKHPFVSDRLDLLDIPFLKQHRKGFDLEYMSAEHRLDTFLTATWAHMIPQLKDKFGTEEAESITKRMWKLFHCKGLVYNKKKAYQCHHPLCPLCFHRKHYRTINDLKPYLKEDNQLHIVRLSERVYSSQIDMAMEALEGRAKKLTASLPPHVQQWIRQSHLSYYQDDVYVASCVILVVCKRTKEDTLDPIYTKHEDAGLSRKSVEASMKYMSPILKEYLYYDPSLLKHGGSRGIVAWEKKAPGFKYRVKHAHR